VSVAGPGARLRAAAVAVLGVAALGIAAAGCTPKDTGYVEIKTVPVAATTTTALFLDSHKLEPVKNGAAVLRQSVGTAKLAVEGAPGKMAVLCDIVVRKNRITSVTVSVLERPPRCQCRNPGAASDTPGGRSCVG
jgi:hypothetical protein